MKIDTMGIKKQDVSTNPFHTHIGKVTMDWRMFFLNPALVWVLIPIAAILLSAIQALAKMYFTHQERIAMIEQGIHPDEASVAVAKASQTENNRFTCR